MTHTEVVVRVRFRTNLPHEKAMEIVERRAPEFEALHGLKQKYYLLDETTGEYAGLYIWSDAESFHAFRDSALRASIAEAYQTVGPPNIEVYRVVKLLRDDGD